MLEDSEERLTVRAGAGSRVSPAVYSLSGSVHQTSGFGVRGQVQISRLRVRAVRASTVTEFELKLPAPGAMHQDGLVANGRAQATTARPRQGDVLIVL